MPNVHRRAVLRDPTFARLPGTLQSTQRDWESQRLDVGRRNIQDGYQMFAAGEAALPFHRSHICSQTSIRAASGLSAMTVNETTREQSPMSGLTPEAMGLLRNALTAWMRGSGEPDPSVTSALHAVATEARERGIRAEELLVTLKSMWFEIGGEPSASSGSNSGHRRLDEVVTACIKAYYQ